MKLCIIPARGGSKRILGKNYKEFLGLPIIAYSIKTAIDSGLFDHVMVSTDDDKIADISKKFGATVPFKRSLKTSDDYATTFDVINEVLQEYDKLHLKFDTICCLYPCAPFVTKDKLEEALLLMSLNSFDTVFPVVRYSNPIQRALKLHNNKVEMVYPNFQNRRSQDLEICYFDAGQFYWASTEKILYNKKLFTNNSGCIILDELNAHDIDNEIDWKIAELKYSLIKFKNHV
jgi:pseudaminic acid cytidylyltransferase